MNAQGSSGNAESGEATIEFIGLALVLLIPVVYLVFTIGTVQSTSLAVEAASRESARILSEDPTNYEYADRQVAQIFSDYGVSAPTEVDARCEPASCTGQARIHVTVNAVVSLPLVPDRWVGSVPIRVHSNRYAPVKHARLHAEP
ncbi:pilus assembly protein [Gleimia hominis]|uniref:pilus assembly protein n=1 Tax=Gleimia hominis TaxID=595468 RepID=UPI000C8086F3|nr:pilus assembly protein [Gleimia hominis]WIK64746.1 pilus assembly protein [Gleimia hominis]